jgi:hypothetical protein
LPCKSGEPGFFTSKNLRKVKGRRLKVEGNEKIDLFPVNPIRQIMNMVESQKEKYVRRKNRKIGCIDRC